MQCAVLFDARQLACWCVNLNMIEFGDPWCQARAEWGKHVVDVQLQRGGVSIRLAAAGSSLTIGISRK